VLGYYAGALSVTNNLVAVGYEAMRYGSNANTTVVGYRAGWRNTIQGLLLSGMKLAKAI